MASGPSGPKGYGARAPFSETSKLSTHAAARRRAVAGTPVIPGPTGLGGARPSDPKGAPLFGPGAGARAIVRNGGPLLKFIPRPPRWRTITPKGCSYAAAHWPCHRPDCSIYARDGFHQDRPGVRAR